MTACKLALALALALCFATTARADSYERERTERLLQSLDLSEAVLPEGRRIAWVRIVRDDVFVKDEVWPTFLNWFHGTTREQIVRRELLFGEGEPYRDARIEETMRNLRGMGIFALVRIVPVTLLDSNDVGVVVHTRDLWSLRLETDFNITTFVDQFILRLTERNFWGHNKTVAATALLRPYSYTLSQSYYDRRLFGSSVALSQSAGIILNREHGKAEGSLWLLELGQPFYNLKQRFGWLSSVSYQDYVQRRLQGSTLARYPDPRRVAMGPYARRAFRERDLLASAAAYLRFGTAFKQTWGLGWDVRSVDAHPIAESMLPPELEAAFRRNVMPLPRTEIGPTFSYEIWTPRYVTFENLSTFGQSENVRVGPLATLSTRVPLAALGSSRDAWVFQASAGFVIAPGGFLLELRALGRTRYERTGLLDQRFETLFRGATPVLFRGFRLVARSSLEARRNDSTNAFVTLGAGNGLRGYRSQEIYGNGASRFLTNVELRTLPIEWQAVHVGAVVFYDVGSVYESLREARFYHAVGLGLRVLFPQFNRYPFSFDGGTSWDPGFRFVPTVTSGQVIPMTAIEDPT